MLLPRLHLQDDWQNLYIAADVKTVPCVAYSELFAAALHGARTAAWLRRKFSCLAAYKLWAQKSGGMSRSH